MDLIDELLGEDIATDAPTTASIECIPNTTLAVVPAEVSNLDRQLAACGLDVEKYVSTPDEEPLIQLVASSVQLRDVPDQYASVQYFPTLKKENGLEGSYTPTELAAGYIIQNETRGRCFALIKDLPALVSIVQCAIRDGHTLHERVDGERPQRAVLDLDCGPEKLAALRNLGYTNETIHAVVVNAFINVAGPYTPGCTQEDMLSRVAVTTSSVADKLSEHILLTSPMLVDHREVRAFLEEVSRCLPQEVREQKLIDYEHISSGYCLRIVGCAKGGRTKTPTEHSIATGRTSIEDYLVQPKTTKVAVHKRRLFSGEPKEYAAVALCNGDVQKVIDAVIEYTMNADEPTMGFRNVAANFINFDRIAPGECRLCGRHHDTDSVYAFMVGGGWVLKCRRGDTKYALCESGISPSLKPEMIGAVTPPNPAIEQRKRECASDAYERYTPEHTYSSRYCKPLALTGDQYLRASWGAGKTHAYGELIRENVRLNGSYTFVLASARKVFTINAIAELKDVGATLYDVIHGDLDLAKNPRTGWQLESFKRIPAGTIVDTVIIDEPVSLALQAMTPLSCGTLAIARYLDLVRNAKQLVVCDNDLTDSMVECYRLLRIGKESTTIENTMSPQSGKQVTIYEGEYITTTFNGKDVTYSARDMVFHELSQFLKNIVKSQKASLPVQACHMACHHKKTLALPLKEYISIYYPTVRVAIYTGDTGDDKKRVDFADINATLSSVDVLITTSALTIGVSCTLEKYTTFFGFYSARAFVEATPSAQSGFRCREVQRHVIAIYGEKGASPSVVDVKGISEWVCKGNRHKLPPMLRPGDNPIARHLTPEELADSVRTNPAYAMWMAAAIERYRSAECFAARLSTIFTRAGMSVTRKPICEKMVDAMSGWDVYNVFTASGIAIVESTEAAREKRCAKLVEAAVALSGDPTITCDAKGNSIRDKPMKTAFEKRIICVDDLCADYGVNPDSLTDEWIEYYEEPSTRRGFKNISARSAYGSTNKDIKRTLLKTKREITGPAVTSNEEGESLGTDILLALGFVDDSSSQRVVITSEILDEASHAIARATKAAARVWQDTHMSRRLKTGLKSKAALMGAAGAIIKNQYGADLRAVYREGKARRTENITGYRLVFPWEERLAVLKGETDPAPIPEPRPVPNGKCRTAPADLVVVYELSDVYASAESKPEPKQTAAPKPAAPKPAAPKPAPTKPKAAPKPAAPKPAVRTALTQADQEALDDVYG